MRAETVGGVLQPECVLTLIYCRSIRIYFLCVSNVSLVKRPVQNLEDATYMEVPVLSQ